MRRQAEILYRVNGVIIYFYNLNLIIHNNNFVLVMMIRVCLRD
jgi:hypothetical protein